MLNDKLDEEIARLDKDNERVPAEVDVSPALVEDMETDGALVVIEETETDI